MINPGETDFAHILFASSENPKMVGKKQQQQQQQQNTVGERCLSLASIHNFQPVQTYQGSVRFHFLFLRFVLGLLLLYRAPSFHDAPAGGNVSGLCGRR